MSKQCANSGYRDVLSALLQRPLFICTVFVIVVWSQNNGFVAVFIFLCPTPRL